MIPAQQDALARQCLLPQGAVVIGSEQASAPRVKLPCLAAATKDRTARKEGM